ncbi:MAG: ErmE/ErmH/ErmO/ErmR family 23S rRNA (adenine(2058)-N(6))-methyltransferase [Hamadaea sp.]|nr:ErmE/ErmH/ErmO/ErmR family 23S rRNA (adenine(2058)-N(6))-methyltransferase [Hamadaea sp.]
MARNFSSRKSGFGNFSHTQGRTGSGAGRTPRDRARRELSQNFLADPRAADLLIKAADPAGTVLEPGAGDGVITRALAEAGARVVAYEIDPLLTAKLKARLRDHAAVRVVRGDFTKARPPGEPFAVVGNIPFSVTAGIVAWCLRAPHLTSATLVTQLEYARKRTGGYGRWSRLTASTWPWFTWDLAGRIGRESFRPVPAVDSGVLRIRRRPDPLVADPQAFADLVELGFTGVGGTLRASLRTRYAGVDAALAAAGIAPDTVVAFVHPDQWVALYEALPHP